MEGRLKILLLFRAKLAKRNEICKYFGWLVKIYIQVLEIWSLYLGINVSTKADPTTAFCRAKGRALRQLPVTEAGALRQQKGP